MTEVNERTDTQPMATASQRWISVLPCSVYGQGQLSLWES